MPARAPVNVSNLRGSRRLSVCRSASVRSGAAIRRGRAARQSFAALLPAKPDATFMPLVRSNSGNSRSYAPLNPPDIKTFNCADAATGQNGSVAKTTNEKVFMDWLLAGGAPRACDQKIAHLGTAGDLAAC